MPMGSLICIKKNPFYDFINPFYLSNLCKKKTWMVDTETMSHSVILQIFELWLIYYRWNSLNKDIWRGSHSVGFYMFISCVQKCLGNMILLPYFHFNDSCISIKMQSSKILQNPYFFRIVQTFNLFI